MNPRPYSYHRLAPGARLREMHADNPRRYAWRCESGSVCPSAWQTGWVPVSFPPFPERSVQSAVGGSGVP
jgi:hypothetical protein